MSPSPTDPRQSHHPLHSAETVTGHGALPPPSAPQARPDDPGVAPGRVFDVVEAQRLVGERYRVERIAGEGGMGRVLLASDTVLSRRVAIKLLNEVRGHAGGEQARSRLLAEARAMAGLNHPNIVRVLEISLDGQPGGGVPFMVMEWIDGVPLGAAWRGLGVNERVSLLLKIVDGVAAAHGAGLVHGDLKPSNILLDRSGQPVIVDFGLARSGRTESSVGGAVGGAIAGGTPGYAAPEQFTPGGPIGAWSDVYALGVILFEMLTARVPFLGATTTQTLRMQREEDPPLPEQLAPESPVSLQRICLVALERDPWRRYKDAGELAQDLRRYMRGETVTARPTMLAARFVDQVQEQIERAGQWRKQGLVTEAEQRALTRTLRTVLRPDSPWLIDSRRLTASQVSLYLGGWLLILGLSVGSYKAWDELPDWLRLALPIAVTAVLGAGGAWLHRRGYQRTGLAYLVTASIAAPVATLLLLKRLGWPEDQGGVGMGAAEFFADVSYDGAVRHAPAGGLYNMQMLIAAGVWAGTGLLMRRVFKSSAFTLLATVGAIVTGVCLWLVSGGYQRPHGDQTWANLALWLMGMGAAGLTVGMGLSRQEEKDAARVGLHNVRRADAWPLLTFGMMLLFVGLSLTAWYAPQRFGLPRWLGAERQAVQVALGLVVSGCVLALVSGVLSRGTSITKERLGQALRWVLPTHFLAPLVVLRYEKFGEAEWPWIAGLAGGAVFLVYASVIRQWKPFLVNGLVYSLVAYVLAFNKVLETGQHFPAGKVWMMAGMVVLGLVVMVLAWWGPIFLATARGRWWLVMAKRRMAVLTRTATRPPGQP